MNVQASATANEGQTRVSSFSVTPNLYSGLVTERPEVVTPMEAPLEADISGSLEAPPGPVVTQTEAVQSGTSLGDGFAPAARIISRNVSREARPYLVGDIATLMKGLEGIALTVANEAQIPVSGINIGLKYLRKDRRRNPHVWMEVKTSHEVHPNQALALWDAIGLGIDRWLPRLRPRMRRLLEDQVSLSVDWVEPHGRSI